MTKIPTPARVKAIDWQSVPADRMAALYQLEAERWASQLSWDTSRDWNTVERGRLLGTVSGVAVVDDAGAVVAWSYYLVHQDVLQVGAFVAASEFAAQLMLARILSADTLRDVHAVTLFAFADAPGLAQALRERGLSVDRYWYLSREIGRGVLPPLPDLRRWRFDDLQATADLLRTAYESPDQARPFAPRGTQDEWLDYTSQLTTGTGCGTLLPDACLCVPGGPNRLFAVALVTRIADRTAHLMQLAVAPDMRSRRLGSQLLELASVAAAQAGCERITLLVGGRNTRARRLYETAGFEAVGSFLASGSLQPDLIGQPRLSTSVAPGGTLMTRR